MTGSSPWTGGAPAGGTPWSRPGTGTAWPRPGTGTAWPRPGTGTAHSARVWNYLLGGKDNSAGHQDAAGQPGEVAAVCGVGCKR